jgi:hypothetical protein
MRDRELQRKRHQEKALGDYEIFLKCFSVTLACKNTLDACKYENRESSIYLFICILMYFCLLKYIFYLGVHLKCFPTYIRMYVEEKKKKCFHLMHFYSIRKLPGVVGTWIDQRHLSDRRSLIDVIHLSKKIKFYDSLKKRRNIFVQTQFKEIFYYNLTYI